jgi:hypothetical protein
MRKTIYIETILCNKLLYDIYHLDPIAHPTRPWFEPRSQPSPARPRASNRPGRVLESRKRVRRRRTRLRENWIFSSVPPSLVLLKPTAIMTPISSVRRGV